MMTDGLVRGHGPTVTHWFLEPTCPHSARAFEKLPALLEAVGTDRLTIVVILQSQPWHLFSGVVCRAILAATLLPDGEAMAWRVMEAVYAHREEFVATDHSRGPNMAASPKDILERISESAGIAVDDVFLRPEALALLKRHTRFARQNGIHVSPTVMVDGLVDEAISSRDDIANWSNKLKLA